MSESDNKLPFYNALADGQVSGTAKLRGDVDALEQRLVDISSSNPVCKTPMWNDAMQVTLARCILNLCDKLDAAKKPTAFELLSRAGIINAL